MTNKEAKGILQWELNNFKYTDNEFVEATKVAIKALEDRPKGEWIITNQDSDGIHEIECPFCKSLKGGDFRPRLILTFDKLPLFCDCCGADMRGDV